MTAFVIPSRLAENFSDRPEWIVTLPGIVAELAERWELRVDEPYQPGGNGAWVAPARDAAGRDLALKVGWRHPEAEHEADGLLEWHGDGTVLLHAWHRFDTADALLLERCSPGASLTTRPEPEQDVVITDLLARLWTVPPAGHPFRGLEVMCRQWVDGFEGSLDGPDAGLARAGVELFLGLPQTAEREVLLCTDLHAENVLTARREPWLAIDPKPYLGDPTYDVLQHLLNCPGRLLADPFAVTDRLAGLAGLDPDRLRQWLFARCVIGSPDDPPLWTVARTLAPGI